MDEEHGIAAVVRRMIDSWNSGDPEGFAQAFTPSADYITGEGQRIHGRQAIAELVKQNRSGLAVELVGDYWIECRGGVANARFGWAGTGQARDTRRGNITCKLVRNGAHWLIEMLRNDEGKQQ